MNTPAQISPSEENSHPLSEQALADLARIHKTFFIDDDKTTPYREVLDALGNATQAVCNDTETAIVTTLIQYWFDHFKTRIKWKLPTTTGTLSNMLVVAHMLNEHNLVGTMTRTTENCKILAWMCLSRLAAYEMDSFHIPVDDIGVILKSWCGEQNVESSTPTLASTVALLYGPGVWELCAPDAGHIEKVPSHLYNLGLDVFQQLSAGQTGITRFNAADLPNDL